MECYDGLLQAESPENYLHSHVIMRWDRHEKTNNTTGVRFTFTDAEQAEIDKFCEEYGSDGKAVDEDGKTLLHKATGWDMEKKTYWNNAVAKFLVSIGADVNAVDQLGMSPLHYAAYYGCLEVVSLEVAKFLVTEGANVNAKNNKGQSPLHLVAISSEWRCIEVAMVLVSEMADVNTKDKDGNTPLHSVANSEVAKFLVSNGADFNVRNNDRKTPLDIAKEKGNIAILEHLYYKSPFKDMFEAAEKGTVLDVEYFIKYRADGTGEKGHKLFLDRCWNVPKHEN